MVAWNAATAAVLTDFATLASGERNILRLMFLRPEVRARNEDWAATARFVVGAFRADAVRAGACESAQPLVDELCRESPEFAALWRDADVVGPGEGVKRITHPALGPLAFDFTSFAVSGHPDLAMMVYTPGDPANGERIRGLLTARA